MSDNIGRFGYLTFKKCNYLIFKIKRDAQRHCFFDYYRQLRTKIKVIRIFNTYGPKMQPDDGRVICYIYKSLPEDDPKQRQPNIELAKNDKNWIFFDLNISRNKLRELVSLHRYGIHRKNYARH